jgi:hypothetical protein
MSTDGTQVMRVLDRCLDTARSGSGAVPGVAAAATFAKADPELRQAVAQLLDEEDGTSSREIWTTVMAAIREAESGTLNHIERCERTRPFSRILSSCTAASRAVSGADPRTASILAQTLLAAVMLERSSLGNDRSRWLRNSAAHGDVAAALALSRRLADCPPGADQ